MTTAPDMLRQFGGVPVASAGYTSPWSTVYFVDGISGTAGAKGLSPDDATLTVSQAITLASLGDVIYIRQLAPKTDQTDPTPYTDNWLIPNAKYGMSLIGTGNNPHNPFYTQIKPGTAGYGVEIKAPSTTIENLCFNKGTASTGIIFFSGDVNSTDMAWGCLISNCHIRNANSAANAGVKFYAGSYNTIHNCDFEGCHTGVHLASGGTYPIRSPRIQDCRFKPENATASGGSYIGSTGGSVIYEIEILRCYFELDPTGYYIDLPSSTMHGLISDCKFAQDDITCGTAGGDLRLAATVKVANCHDDAGALIAST